MKKLISLLLVLTLLLACCGCKKEAAQDPVAGTTVPATTMDPESPEALFGHVDQFTPVDGVYQIWNKDGVQNIYNHLDGSFVFLCSVDMQGAVLAPIGSAETPFTGKIVGDNFTLSNFTVQGDQADFGVFGVNQGTIQNLLMDQVTLLPGANVKNVGGIAGTNSGTLLRCTLSNSALTVEQAQENANCGGAVGVNTGKLQNTIARVDLAYNAAGSANVGGIAGAVLGGVVEYTQTDGRLDVTGANKNVGLFAGHIEDVVMVDCVFMGASSTLDGKMFENFTGNPDDDERVVASGALYRDNDKPVLSDKVVAVRTKAVKAMYDMGTIRWIATQDLPYTDRSFPANYVHYGIPYNHKSGSLAQAQYCIGENDMLKEWLYTNETLDDWDMYFGSDCSGALQQAWWTVSNSTDVSVCQYMYPSENSGTIPVGDYKCDFSLSKPLESREYLDANDEQTMYESYAQMRFGDAYVYHKEGAGHTRMAAEDPVVVRDQDGNIRPDYSYVVSHEQGYTSVDNEAMTHSSWRIGFAYTFASLYADGAVPITCEELLTGEQDPAEAVLEGKEEGYAGMISGVVETNYHLDSVTLKITDSQGVVVLEQPLFVDVHKNGDFGSAYYRGRNFNTTFEMATFAQVLANTSLSAGESYHYTVTADLATFDHIVVNEGNFTYGA